VAAITDIRIDEIRNQMEDRGFHDIRYYQTPEEMLSAESLDGKQSAETGTFQEIAWDRLKASSRAVGSAMLNGG
jgi:hypothetical protein